jgi:hypothetical protein
MHWIRRLHLYSGLFMFPWVMLYGVTAFLFNHPGAFSDQQQDRLRPLEIPGTPLPGFPRPEELAQKVVDSLEKNKASGSAPSASSYRLVEPSKASYNRDFVFARVEAEGEQHDVRVAVADGSVQVSTRQTAKPMEKAPFAHPSLKAAGLPGDQVKEALPALLERNGLGGNVKVVISPELSFLMESDEQVWRVSYDTLSGRVTGRPAEDAADRLSTRRFLLGLHLAHAFPATINARWLWAVAVDATFVAMVFWGVSGILMFWQIKAVRRWGMALLLVGAVLATALAWGMHGELTR